MQASDDSLIAFATDAGQVADDNAGESNGLYTQELLKNLKTPGLLIEEVIKRTRSEVKRRSGKKQTPAEYSKLEGNIILVPAIPVVQPWESARATLEPSLGISPPGISPRDSVAIGALRSKAEAGDAGAQIDLARRYRDGVGVPKDATAQFNLGACYLNGLGVARSAEEAAQWMRKAAKAGDVDAKKRLTAHKKTW